jgi:hypothetical protein
MIFHRTMYTCVLSLLSTHTGFTVIHEFLRLLEKPLDNRNIVSNNGFVLIGYLDNRNIVSNNGFVLIGYLDNRNIVSNNGFVLIGQFWSRSKRSYSNVFFTVNSSLEYCRMLNPLSLQASDYKNGIADFLLNI